MKIFEAAFFAVANNLCGPISWDELFKICALAGKSARKIDPTFLITESNTNEIKFDKALEIFNSLQIINFEQEWNRIEENFDTSNIYASIIRRLNQRNDIDEEMKIKIKKLINFYGMNTAFDGCRLFGEIELIRQKVIENITDKYNEKNQQNVIKTDGERNEDNHVQFYTIRRRAFRHTDEQETRTLEFRFNITQETNISMEIELLRSDDQMPNATYENQLFAIICEINSGEIMAITNRLNDKNYCTDQLKLPIGKYSITFHIFGTNSIISTNSNNKADKAELMNTDGKLNKHFKMTLANIFDLFDFDENGTLNRTEFDIYNVVTSNDHVTDKEWSIITNTFTCRNAELTLQTFIELHQLDMSTSETTDDTWASLFCIGYNEQLILQKNCPCSITVTSNDEIEFLEADFRTFSNRELVTLIEYFWKNGICCAPEINSNIKLWKCEYFAVCVSSPMTLEVPIKIDCSQSKNVQISELSPLQMHFDQPTIIFFAKATNSQWSIVVNITTYQ